MQVEEAAAAAAAAGEAEGALEVAKQIAMAEAHRVVSHKANRLLAPPSASQALPSPTYPALPTQPYLPRLPSSIDPLPTVRCSPV